MSAVLLFSGFYVANATSDDTQKLIEKMCVHACTYQSLFHLSSSFTSCLTAAIVNKRTDIAFAKAVSC